MTNEEAKEFLSHYICCCQYGNSPFDCDYAECKFGIAVRTLCDEERQKGAWESGGFCFSTMSYKCPFCKSKTLERTKFCSECGADMRGDKQ